MPPPYTWTTPVAPAAIEHDGPAWEDRDSIGGLKAAAKTVGELLGNSDWAFTRMKRTADWAGPFCFALFLGGVGYYVNLSYSILYSVIASFINPGALKGMAFLLTTGYGAGFIIIATYFFIPVMFAFITLLNSVLIHFSLMLMGGVKQPFQTTWRVVCYSFGTSSVLQVIPVLGFFLTLVWNLILMIRGIAKMHEISMGKAILALTPVVLYTGYFILLCMGMV